MGLIFDIERYKGWGLREIWEGQLDENGGWRR